MNSYITSNILLVTDKHTHTNTLLYTANSWLHVLPRKGQNQHQQTTTQPVHTWFTGNGHGAAARKPDTLRTQQQLQHVHLRGGAAETADFSLAKCKLQMFPCEARKTSAVAWCGSIDVIGWHPGLDTQRIQSCDCLSVSQLKSYYPGVIFGRC